MHKYFADWYKFCTSGVATTSELLEKRWTGVEALADCANLSPIDLVRILLGKKKATTETIDAFRTPFKEADSAFFMKDNDVEVRVLAGAVLGQILESEGDHADQAALALHTSTGLGIAPAWCLPIVSLAEAYLLRRLTELRSPSNVTITVPAMKNLKAQFEALSAALAANTPAESGVAAKQIGDTLIPIFAGFAKQVSQSVEALESECEFRREESDVLWWMTSAVSRDLSKSFKELRHLASVIVAGKELADLVSPPGILPARALLTYVVPPATKAATGKPVAIRAAIGATSEQWRTMISERIAFAEIEDVCPILAAIKYSLQGGEWETGYKKEYSVDTNAKFDPIALAIQIHRECLLVKALA